MALLLGLFYVAIMLALLSSRPRVAMRGRLGLRPALLFLVPLVLWSVFTGVLALVGGVTAGFALLLAAYLLMPSLMVYAGRHWGRRLGWRDLVAVLLLWLPVEFTLGKSLIPVHAHSLANEAAQGSATVLALALFVVFRDWPDHKYCWPRRAGDLKNALVGFVVLALPLAVLGRLLGFLGPFQLPAPPDPVGFLRRFIITLLGVAIPEELLFRSLIQNWLVRRFGHPVRGLLAAALVFGASHLNNAPGPLPNWRYMILATIAGLGYGLVFQRSSSVLASAVLHAFVNTVRHTFFR